MDKRDILIEQSRGKHLNMVLVVCVISVATIVIVSGAYYLQSRAAKTTDLSSFSSATHHADRLPLKPAEIFLKENQVNDERLTINKEIESFQNLYELNENLISSTLDHPEFGILAEKTLISAETAFDQMEQGLDPELYITEFHSQLVSLKSAIEVRVTNLLTSMDEALKTGKPDLYKLSLQSLLSINISTELHQEYVDFQNRQEEYFETLQIAQTHERNSEYSNALATYKQIKSLNPPSYHFAELETQLDLLIFSQTVEKLISETEIHISNARYDEAIKSLSELSALDPSSTYSASRSLEVMQLQREEKILHKLQEGKALLADEKYQEAFQHFKEVLVLSPNHIEADSNVRNIQTLLNIQSQLENLLEAPERLSDSNVGTFASTLINSYRNSTLQSEQVEEFISRVQNHMNSASTPRSIEIISDNISTIEVVGVGFVRPTYERTISLSPKVYNFNVSCNGHQDYIMEVIIPPAPSPIPPIEAFCGKEL